VVNTSWGGPTPYDKDIEDDPTERGYLDRRHGYIEAMNSPEVRTMYQAIKYRVARTDLEMDLAFAAYEAGLKETE
jgi:hypothetical protein